MTLQITLSPEIESQLLLLAQSQGKDMASLVMEAVEEKLADEDGVRPCASAEERVREFDRLIAGCKPVGHFVDDSRERIYEGRGE